MIFKDISILTENVELREHVDVVISGDKIKTIKDTNSNSEGLSMESENNDEEIIMGHNLVMMPGFYNAHAHSTMSLMRGYGENMTLQDWLFKRIFPFEDHLYSEAVYYGTMLSMAESFKYGIVSTSDMYYFIEDMVQAYVDSGAKGNISRAIVNPDEVPFEELPSIHETKECFEKHNNKLNGRIVMEGSLHAEYTSDENTARRLADLAKELGMRMHIHVSETKKEHDECKERRNGRTPVKYLSDTGLLDIPALAAHCVWIEEEDRDILAEKKVTVATNPVSNLKLASGVCDVKALMDKGIRVAVGTDSVASNNNLSMFEEMKTMMLLAKTKYMDPTIISPKEALLMATRNGALAQGREDCGFIKEGYKADLVLLNTDSPNMQPQHNLVNNIVLSATDSDIKMTIVDGNVVYRDGVYPTIDIKEVVEGANAAVRKILTLV